MKQTTEFRTGYAVSLHEGPGMELRKKLVETLRHMELLALYQRERLPFKITISRLPRSDEPDGWMLEQEWL